MQKLCITVLYLHVPIFERHNSINEIETELTEKTQQVVLHGFVYQVGPKLADNF